ncbi:MAG: hypothetical protein OEV99_06375 [Nitrospira sp.]|nr:hypothetical protein [Nitrospira sp.]MDH4369456.1 hypothetical protein [Nitrospira sp.]MDH5496380.1 hypothetical protein [Nitrospira sp.]MDH5724485.1 hypothetical protein [Nitrospira sp.]
MEFRFTYRGPLKGNSARPEDKQRLRRSFHLQLKQLWSLEPLKSRGVLLAEQTVTASSVIFDRAGFKFAPLISERLFLHAELQVLFLRPEPKGFILTGGGDIDNRLKTLLDSLRVPRSSQELPKDDKPKESEDPFFCLLEDDSLVTSVSVSADQLLEPIDPGHVLAIIKVKMVRTRDSWANSGL